MLFKAAVVAPVDHPDTYALIGHVQAYFNRANHAEELARLRHLLACGAKVDQVGVPPDMRMVNITDMTLVEAQDVIRALGKQITYNRIQLLEAMCAR